MCGIVGAVAERNVTNILVEGLRRLEYRGYDSAGLAVINQAGSIARARVEGKVQGLADKVATAKTKGQVGIAHTRWATHGEPNETNAHPHVSDQLVIVHNGIIENYQTLKVDLQGKGYQFVSQTDTEVVAHLIASCYQQTNDLVQAVKLAVKQLDGAYALGVIHEGEPEKLVTVRSGSPLVIGLGIGENFIGSDQLALLPVTNRFIFLEEGDLAVLTRETILIEDQTGQIVKRKTVEYDGEAEDIDKGQYRHYMQKEIYEQPQAVSNTIEQIIQNNAVYLPAYGNAAEKLLSQVKHIHIIACGTSYHAGMVARYWLEAMTGVACHVEVASEFRYRAHVVPDNCLMVTISQSGETADTLAALRNSLDKGYIGRLAICNVPTSSLVRESEMCFITKAGVEIGVASTKAFTTQLVALYGLALAIQKAKGLLIDEGEQIRLLRKLPSQITQALQLDDQINQLSELFADKQHTLFLGRGIQYPIAMEGALKLKEISYIHAESYPAGELKHGPLALVDEHMPIVAVAPNDGLIDKLKSNLEEVRARGAQLVIFADENISIKTDDAITVLPVSSVDEILAPIVYTIPLQLLSYHVALIKGTDVDQPRNLAKSVTVE